MNLVLTSPKLTERKSSKCIKCHDELPFDTDTAICKSCKQEIQSYYQTMEALENLDRQFIKEFRKAGRKQMQLHTGEWVDL